MIFDISIVGYTAGFCTAIAQFPQAYKVIKTGDTHSISLGMYSIMTFGILVWLIYGFLLHDMPMILSNGVCLIPSIYTLFVTMRNNIKNKKARL
ncbi:MAG: SemiSWEET transporter [Paludibacter sp.]|nr:SemiSWEET transporter [Paludibacter sp.]